MKNKMEKFLLILIAIYSIISALTGKEILALLGVIIMLLFGICISMEAKDGRTKRRK